MSEHRATSSRNARATSSEYAPTRPIEHIDVIRPTAATATAVLVLMSRRLGAMKFAFVQRFPRTAVSQRCIVRAAKTTGVNHRDRVRKIRAALSQRPAKSLRLYKSAESRLNDGFGSITRAELPSGIFEMKFDRSFR
jgi:hypothetical protein